MRGCRGRNACAWILGVAQKVYVALQNRRQARRWPGCRSDDGIEGASPMSTLSLSPSAVARRSRRRSWFARAMAALQESRMRSARETMARYRHLLPADYETAGRRLTARNEDQLEFTRD